MCGITGYLNLNNKPASKKIIDSMTQMIKHRGPDALATYTNKNIGIGHTRLSIVDTSEKGNQPMFSHCGNFIISYNGEIYNYLSLKKTLIKKGFKFQSNTDTEVVLNGFIRWKDKLLGKLNGMFAFAIWDKRNQSLFIARDRYGIKPVYFAKINHTFLFSSEVKAFFQHPEFNIRINKQSILEYFTFQNFFTNETLFKNVFTLKPGNYLHIKRGEITTKEYWDYSFESNKLSKKDNQKLLLEKLRKAVKSQHIGDKEINIGCYLSGGMDSGTITSISSEFHEDLKTFTIGYDTNSMSGIEIIEDERNIAEFMSYLFKTEHYEMVLKSGDMESCMRKLIWHLEVPKVGQSYPNYYASKLASKFCKVVLTGTGGDELFAGYPWRYYRAIVNDNFENYCKKYYNFWNRMIPDSSYKNFFSPLKGIEYNTFEIFKNVLKKFKKKKYSHSDYVNSSLYLEAKTFLVGLLEVEDKLSMSNGLESRVPFLDNDLVDLSLKIPVSYKLGNLSKIIYLNENSSEIKTEKYFSKTNDGKLILRQVMENFVPKSVTKGIKRGFSLPDNAWFSGESIKYVKEKILSRKAKIFEFLDRKEVFSLVNHHLHGKENRRLLIWSLLCFEEWIETFLEGKYQNLR